jgi:arsenate reductase (thioredoxin)
MNVLFLCTHNSARSILAEALLNHLGAPLVKAYSAGSSPRENQMPHPMGLAALEKRGIATADLSSKSWDVFAQANAPQMDVIITVCDNAAGEVCPIWPGHPATVHWGYPDPSAGNAAPFVVQQAFEDTLLAIERRIRAFLALPLPQLKGDALRVAIQSLDHV